MGRTLLQKPLASRSWLRRNSNALPWNWFVPDFETKLSVPPEALPVSALKPLASTVNSVRASTEGLFIAAAPPFPASLPILLPARDEPSSVMPAVSFPPPIRKVPAALTSPVVDARSKGLLELPFTSTGSASTSALDTSVATLAFSVCSTCEVAVTSTLCCAVPTSSLTSTRAVPPAVITTLSMIFVLKPCFSTLTWYSPTGKEGTVKSPDVLVVVLYDALVALRSEEHTSE